MSRHHSRIRRLESRYRSHTRADDDANTRIPDDPIAVARLLGFEPDPWQCDLLTSTDERVILNCSRQTGKSTSVAILALHHALTTRDSVVLIISPSLRQSELLFEKISTFYRKLGSRAALTLTQPPRSNSETAAASLRCPALSRPYEASARPWCSSTKPLASLKSCTTPTSAPCSPFLEGG